MIWQAKTYSIQQRIKRVLPLMSLVWCMIPGMALAQCNWSYNNIG
jgi:hypothetical protein